MEKNTRTKNILLVVLLVAVLTLSISYAALSQYLYINSTAVIGSQSTNWNVAFTAVSCAPTNYAEITTPFNSPSAASPATTLSGLVATLKAPGDSVVCDITIKNQGTIDAVLSTFTLNAGTVSYVGTAGDSKTADETLTNNKLIYSIVYAQGDTSAGLVPGAQGADDTLPHPVANDPTVISERHVTLTIGYPANETSMPENDVTVSGLSTTFLYIQN